ncbi:OmpL47-type beta-barrel domain-containing protein [Paenibacillus chartarius]|uniref:OmpL47-type beta-barrel domain-containing protein n=1 Tax=Paenibacillus chartarius TaxID=747481 RepID=A0ABV6DU96_9BACL
MLQLKRTIAAWLSFLLVLSCLDIYPVAASVESTEMIPNGSMAVTEGVYSGGPSVESTPKIPNDSTPVTEDVYSAAVSAESTAMIPNGGFESGLWHDKTDGWTLDSMAVTEGVYSAKATGDPVNRRFMSVLASNINPDNAYRLSAWIKMDGISNNSGVSISVLQVDANNQALGYLHSKMKLIATGGTQDWTQYSIPVENFDDGTAAVRIIIRLDAGVTGTVWFDNVSLVPSSPSPANLLFNGGFEGGFWPERTDGFIMDQTVSREGSSSMRTSGDPTQRRFMATDPISINASETYQLSAYIKMEQVSNHSAVSLSVLQVDDKNQGLGYVNGQMKLITTGGTQDWTRYTVSFGNFIEGTSHIRVYVRLDEGVTGTVWFDDIVLGPGSLDTNNAIPNGGFEGGFWAERTDGFYMDQSVSHEGITSMRTSGDPQERRFMATRPIPIDPSGTYQLSAWIKMEGISNNSAVSLSVLQIDAQDQGLGYVNSQMKIITTGGTQDWTQYAISFGNFAEGTVSIRIYIRLDAGVSGTVWFDDVRLGPGTIDTGNMIVNGGFQGGFWPERTDGFVMDQTVAHEGTTSMRTSGDPTERRYMATGAIPVDIKNAYEFSAWIKTDGVTNDSAVSVSIMEVNSSNQSLGYLHLQMKLFSTGGTQEWTQYKAAVKNFTPSTAAIRVYIRLDAGVEGTVWFDQVRLEPLPFNVSQTKAGNVFVDPEPVKFDVRSNGDTVHWEVRDERDNWLLEGNQPVQDGKATVNVPITAYGYFQIQIKSMQNNVAIDQYVTPFVRLSAMSDYAAGHGPFGVNTHFKNFGQGNNETLLEMIKKSGTTQVRDEITWSSVEPQLGVYTPPAYSETYMNDLQQHNIEPMIIMDYTNPNYDNNSTVYTDAGRQGFANYGKFLIQHYGDQIKTLEVYNEYNAHFGDIGNGPADSRPDYYYLMLKKTYETIKPAYPNVKILGMSVAHIDLEWIEEVFKLGGLQYMDAISVHPYYYPDEPELLADELVQLQNLIKTYNNGQMKPIWITEFGWPTHQSSSGTTELQQSAYLVRYYVTALAAGVEKVFLYDFMNDGLNKGDREHNFGIVRFAADPLGPYTPKPAYATYATMVRQLQDAQFVRKDTVTDNVYSYLFTFNNEPIRIMWTKDTTDVTLHTNAPVTITDMMGNSKQYTPFEGKVMITLSGDPLYVKGDVTEITEGSLLGLNANAPVISGDAINVTLSVSNPHAQTMESAFHILGSSYSLVTPSGGTSQQVIQLSSSGKLGVVRVVSDVYINGGLSGRMVDDVTIQNAFDVRIRPNLTEAASTGEQMILSVENHSPHSGLTTESISWVVGGQSGVWNQQVTIPALTTSEIAIDLPSLDLWKNHSYKVTVKTTGHNPNISEGAISFNPVLQKTIDPAGPLNMAEVPGIDLAASGTMQILANQSYHGPSDLSGRIWVNWDQNNFYLTAQITDDTFSHTSEDSLIWSNDSIQFAVKPGLPESTELYDEFGLSMTPSGPQVYRFHSSNNNALGLVANSRLTVTRNETDHQTVYKLAIPWEELGSVDPFSSEPFSFSTLVNDNDGTIRKGYYEWASGIGRYKDPALYRPAQWVKTDFTAPVTTAVTQPAQPDGNDQWFINPITVSLPATDDPAGVAETVYSLDAGGQWQTYSGPFTFSQDGMYTVSYKSTDLANNEETAKTLSMKLDLTAPVTSAALTPSAPNGNNGWYRSDVTLKLTAADGLSGVGKIQYSTDNGTTWLSYTGPVTFSTEGKYKVLYRTQDAAGNVEAAKSVTFQIDKKAPSVTFSVYDGKVYWIDEDVIITCQAIDATSGIAASTCKNISAPAYRFNIGMNTVRATAVDKAGNTGSATIRFEVKISIESLIRLFKKLLEEGSTVPKTSGKSLDGLATGETMGNSEYDVDDFKKDVVAQRGKGLTAEEADLLLRLADKID